jgi:hypothetical protein
MRDIHRFAKQAQGFIWINAAALLSYWHMQLVG